MGDQRPVPEAWTCVTCGVQHAPSADPPKRCDICEDERQYVGADGQRWTTSAELAVDHRVEVTQVEPDLHAVSLTPAFAIGQRALLVRTPGGNVLWDCLPLLDDAAHAELERLGGVAAICISHPHFYAAHAELAEVLDATVHLPRADAAWVRRASPRTELYDESVSPVPGVTVTRIGGHFEGASVLHWPAGAEGRGVLLTGDTIQVVPDRGWVSFMWSYPNLLPLDAASVLAIAARVEPLAFDRLYGGWSRSVLAEGASDAVRRSAARYVARLRGDRPGEPLLDGPGART